MPQPDAGSAPVTVLAYMTDLSEYGCVEHTSTTVPDTYEDVAYTLGVSENTLSKYGSAYPLELVDAYPHCISRPSISNEPFPTFGELLTKFLKILLINPLLMLPPPL